MYTITVSNLNDSGTGSLRQAILDANAYSGTDEIQIIFDAALAGQELILSSGLPILSKACTVEGNGVILPLYGFTISAPVTFNNITYPQLILSGAEASLVADTLNLTLQEAIRIQDGAATIDFSGLSASVDGAYIGIGNTTLYSSILKNGGPDFSGGYKLRNHMTTVAAAQTVTLEEGVQIGRTGSNQRLYIEGTLQSRNETVADALVCNQTWGYTHVRKGGKLLLENANVNLSGGGCYFYVEDGGTLEMQGGSLLTSGGVEINAGGTATLTEVTVKSCVTSSGSLTAEDVQFQSYVHNMGTGTYTNCVFHSYLQVNGVDNLHTEGISFTGAETYRLNGFTGSTAELLESIEAAEANSYMGLNGTLNTTTLVDVSSKLAEGYKMVGDVTVAANHTVTLNEGVQIGCTARDQYLYIEGTLVVENEVVADALVSNQIWGDVNVRKGGKLLLENGNVNLNAAGNGLYVEDGGLLEMQGGSLLAPSWITIYTGGTASLNEVTVKSGLSNSGTLTAEKTLFESAVNNIGTGVYKDCTFNSYLQVNGVDNLEVSGLGFAGAETFRLNGFSGSTAELLAGFEANEANTYIGLYETIYTTTLVDVSSKLAEGYKMVGDVTVAANHTVTLDEGVQIGSTARNQYLYIEGTLVVENEVVADALVSNHSTGDVNVRKGGKLLLKNGNVNLNASGNGLYVEDGGMLEMQGGSLLAPSWITIYTGGTASLNEVTVKSGLSNSGTLTAEKTLFESAVNNIGTGVYTDCTFNSYLQVNGVDNLEGSGLRFAGAETFRLNGFSGSIEELLAVFEANEANTYIGLYETMYTMTVVDVSSKLAEGYKMVGDVTVAANHTVTLDEGVQIGSSARDQYLYISGTLEAKNEVVADALVSNHSTGDVNVRKGGKLLLENANVNLNASGNGLYVENGGMLEMQGGSLLASSGVFINEGGTATLNEVTVKSWTVNAGTLESNGSTFQNCITIHSTDSITGSGNISTASEALRLKNFSGNTGDLLAFFDETAESSYVGIYESLQTATLMDVSHRFAEGYKMVGEVSVGANHTVTLDEGVSLQVAGHELLIYGELKIENTTDFAAIRNNGGDGKIRVYTGGSLKTKNTTISLIGTSNWHSDSMHIGAGGLLEMEGGSLHTSSGLFIDSAAPSLGKPDNGVVSLKGTTVNTAIINRGNLSVLDCEFQKYININTTEGLEGSGNTSTGGEIFRLDGFSGNTQSLLNFYDEISGDAYIGISGTLKTTTLVDVSDTLSENYKMVNNVSVGANHTVTMEEGAIMQMEGHELLIYGELIIENHEEFKAISSSGSDGKIRVYTGGSLKTKNTTISLIGTSNWHSDSMHIGAGGLLEMEGGSLHTSNGLVIDAAAPSQGKPEGGVVNLNGVTLNSSIENGGDLVLRNSRLESKAVTISTAATATITNTSGISTLTINSGSQVSILGNDFSGTTIVLNNIQAGEIIDLSGNYWGTTDMELIKSKIQGYDAEKVIINDMHTVDPTTAFMYLGNSLPQDQIGQGVTEVTFYFSHEVDASTVSAENVRLVNNKGECLPLEYVEVEGHTIRVGFAAMRREGSYRLELGSDIKDIVGSALAAEEQPGQGYDVLKANLTAPIVSNMEPGGDFTGTISGVTLYFSEMVNVATLKSALRLTGPNGNNIAITNVEALGGTAYRISFAEQTAYGQYTVSVGGTVTNLAGNMMNGNGNDVFGEEGDGYTGTFNIADVDLTITGVSVDAAQTAGANMHVSWTGENSTGYELMGSWADGVYLSTDGVWDINDIYLGRVEHSGGLAAGAEYGGSLTVTLPSVKAGDYYVLVRTDINGQEAVDKESYEWVQNLAVNPVAVAVPELQLEQVYQGRLQSDDRYDCYALQQEAGMAVRVNFGDIGDAEAVDVYVSYDSVADATNYDAMYKISSSFNSFRIEASKANRDVSIMVRRKDGKEVAYTLQVVEAQMEIAEVISHNMNAAQECIFDIKGINLKHGAQVVLIDKEGKEYVPDAVDYMSTERIQVKYAAGSLPAGDFSVQVRSNDVVAKAEDAINLVRTSKGSHFVMHVEQPNMLGYHIVSNFTISYENIGYEAMDAPLIFFTIEQSGERKAFLTLDESIVYDGFWTSTAPEGFTSSISFLATGATGSQLLPTGRINDYSMVHALLPVHVSSPPMSGGNARSATYAMRSIASIRPEVGVFSSELSNFIPPSSSLRGEESTVIYYTGWQQPWDFSYPDFNIIVNYVASDNTNPLDWSEVLPNMEDNAGLKDILLCSLEERVGATWGDYVKELNRVLSNLDNMGVDVSNVSTDDLLNHILGQIVGRISPISILSASTDIAVQTTGLALYVARSYDSSTLSHLNRSSFGHGWTHNWDINLTIEDSGDVVLNLPGTAIIFQPDYRGGYQCTAGKGYSLKKNGNGSYKVTVGQGAGDVVYDFTKQGMLTKVTDENGNSITCTYNESGLLSKLTHSNGEWIAYEYTEDGYISKLTASNGEVTEYSYEDGNLISATGMLGDTVNYSYSDDFEHFLTCVEGVNGTKRHFAYGDDGLLAKNWYEAADASATRGETSLSYGTDGGITVTDQYGASSTYYYNLAGQVAKAIDVNGNVLRYAYDSDGNLISSTNQAGHITSYTYDEKGNMTAMTDALGNTTYYEYSSAGLLTRITDANGHAISYEYDTKGQMTGIVYADDSRESWTYDKYGNAASWTTRAGKTVTMAYDAKGNLLSKTVEDEGSTSFTYDALGNVLSSTDSGGTTTWTYDERYRMTKVEHADGHSVSYAYDEKDRIISMTDDTGYATHYSYNVWGDLTDVTDAEGNTVASYEYDEGGRVVRETKGNGTSSSYTYTLTGDVATITHYDAAGQVTGFCNYSYDSLALRTSMATEDGTWTYSYDAIGQLVQADFEPTAGSDVPEQHISYEYDAAGNRTRTVVNGVETLYANNELNQTTAAGDTRYEYDAAGNLIRKMDETGVTTYEWSVEGKLLGMTTATGDVYTYTYNAVGERVSTSVNGKVTTYVYDGFGNGNVVTEYDATGNGKHYQYGSGLIGFEDALSGKYWYESDALGSVTGITDASGNLVATYAYAPFGSTISSTGTMEDAHNWLGLLGLVSDESGLTFMRARYYDAQTGTFISADPINVNGGLNLYAYCLNNSINLVDPTGCISVSDKAFLNTGQGIVTGDGDKITNSVIGIGVANLLKIPKLGGIVGGGILLLTPKEIGPEPSVGPNTPLYNPNHPGSGDDSGAGGSPGGSPGASPGGSPGASPGGSPGASPGGSPGASPGGSPGSPLWPFPPPNPPSPPPGPSYPNPPGGSEDPNDMVGPSGYGEENFITAGQELPFMIRFENEPDATAPTRWIRVFTTFDEAYDLDSFTLDSIYLAGNTISMAEGQDSFNKKVTMTFEGQEVLVDIAINLDYETRELKAEFMALDPQSGTMLMDIMTGMLYPNNESGRGDGYITYTINTKEELETGTTIGNVADIYFDFNEVIPTPEVNYTIDADGPQSRMLSAVDQGHGGEVLLTWEGADAEGGSGVAGYIIYVQKDGGEFGMWKSFTADITSATFAGKNGSEYGFYVQAVDNVGHVEDAKSDAEITARPTSSDTTAPDAVSNMMAISQGDYAVYMWQGVDDPSGVSYLVEIADNAAMEGAMQFISGVPYVAVEGQAYGTWYWRVQAIDGELNAAEWVSGHPFLHAAADPTADNTVTAAQTIALGDGALGSTGNVAPINNWVGAGDEQDFYTFTATADGSYKVGIESADISSPLWLSVGTMENGTFCEESSLLLAPNLAVHAIDRINLKAGEQYYVSVKVANEDAATGYGLSIEGDTIADRAHISANNSVAAATKLEASDDAEGSVDSWVGAGDALDYYCLEMAEDGLLSINLSGLEKNAKVRVYRQREDGAVTQTLSATAKAEGGLDRTLSLTAGTYFIEVAAYDNGAGRYNSTYALELEKEDESGSKQRFTIANA